MKTGMVVGLVVSLLALPLVFLDNGVGVSSPLEEAEFLAVGGDGGAFVNIFQREGNELVRLPDFEGSDAVTAEVESVAWNHNASLLAFGTRDATPVSNISLYSRDGSTFSRLDDLETVNGTVRSLGFSPDGEHLYVGHEVSPFFTVYNRTSEGGFVKSMEPSVGPLDRVFGLAVHPGGELVAVTSFNPRDVVLYRWVDGVLIKLDSASFLPGTGILDAAWSGDGKFLGVTGTNNPNRVIYVLENDALSLIDSSDIEGSVNSVAWAPDSVSFVTANSQSPHIRMHRVVEGSVEVLQRPPQVSGNGRDVDFSSGARGLLAGVQAVDNLFWWDNPGTTLMRINSVSVVSTVSDLNVLAWSPGMTQRPGTPPGNDDFESHEFGLSPLSNWYEVQLRRNAPVVPDCDTTTEPPSAIVNVTQRPDSVDTHAFAVDTRGTSEGYWACFRFGTNDICEFGDIGFDFRWSQNPDGNYPNDPDDVRLEWVFAQGSGGRTDPAVGLTVGGGGVVSLAVGPSGLGPGIEGRVNAEIFTGNPDTWYSAVLDMDCDLGSFVLEVVGAGSGSVIAPDMIGVGLNNFRMVQDGSSTPQFGSHIVWMDNLVMQIEPLVNVPTEFSSGIKAFAQSFGFQTAESLFFFSLILIGLTLAIVGMATQLLGDSRLRAMIVWFSAMGVGVFCVLVLELEFWMFIIAIVLGGAVVAGTGPLGGLVRGVGAPRPMAAGAGAVTEQKVADEIQEMNQEIEDAVLDDERAELQAEQTEGQVIEEVEPDPEKREED